jgi:hypothetical protein
VVQGGEGITNLNFKVNFKVNFNKVRDRDREGISSRKSAAPATPSSRKRY